MKVVKPGKISVLTRCFEHDRRSYMGVSAMAFIPLSTREAIMLSEVELWKFAPERLGTEGALDVGIPKSRGEFLVNTVAYAPGGVAQPVFPVRARVGEVQRDLYVYGDRYWSGGRATEAAPITQMSLDWAGAFGGPDYAKNPRGKGDAEVEIEGMSVRPLPNVESPRALVDSPRQRPEPAGFGPVDISWPQRSKLAGTHDQHWLENLFPGFARDINWDIHNIAQPDQRCAGYWTGTEAYHFDNMHPSKAVVEGELPGLRARVFVSRSHRSGEQRPSFAAYKETTKQVPEDLEEVDLQLQTLWFFPDVERAVLIWQGSVSIAEEDGADIVQLLAAAEHSERPKPLEHYQKVLADRLDEKYGMLAALRDHELLPEDLGRLPDQAPDEDQQLCAVEGLGQANLHRRMLEEAQRARDVVASYGLDPDIHGPTLPEPPMAHPKLDELPDLIAETMAEAETQKAELEARYEKAMAEAEAEVDEAGIDGFSSADLREEIDSDQVGPPKWTAAAEMAGLRALAMECRKGGEIVDEIEDMIVDDALMAQWEEAENNMMAAYRKTAHHQSPAPAMRPELREPTRARVRAAIEQGEDLGTLDFTGADLRGMDLSGANLRRALFESADLRGANLSGAKLDDAVLAHAELGSADFEGASMRAVNLGKAKLGGTVLDDADLEGAIFFGAELEGTKLQRARVTGADFYKTRFVDVDARGLIGEQLVFVEPEIESVDFGGAKLAKSSFLKADLRGSCFDGADLRSCTFLSCDAREVHFLGATLCNARFVEACKLDGADLSEADLSGANLRGTSLPNAILRRATLDDADLCECDLREAKLYRVTARRARIEVADLRGAELIAGNFMQASFARSTLYGVDLRGANLHAADMARVRTDSAVQLDQALLTKVRIHPRHVEHVEPSEEAPQ